MSGASLIQLAAYELAGRSAALLSPLLPPSNHPGKRAQIAHRSVTCSQTIDAALSAKILGSQWQSKYLQRYIRHLPAGKLQQFLDNHVSYAGEFSPQMIASSKRPIIVATPHYGPYVIACLAGVRALNGKKRMNFFYDHHPRNAGLKQLVERAGGDTRALLGGFNGIIAAVKGLQNGECLSMLPDVFQSLADTIVVPFLGRLMRVAAGTAFMCARTDALLVPTYVIPQSRMRVSVRFSTPIEPRLYAGNSERDTIFRISCKLFEDIEQQLRSAPEHWSYWDAYLKASTGFAFPAINDGSKYLAEIRARCAAWPQIQNVIPELRTLLTTATAESQDCKH